jgi:hypothetical protein
MTNSLYEQWMDLCAEYDSVKAEENEANAVITSAFADIAKGGHGNPSDDVLQKRERATERLKEIQTRMDEFIATNT